MSDQLQRWILSPRGHPDKVDCEQAEIEGASWAKIPSNVGPPELLQQWNKIKEDSTERAGNMTRHAVCLYIERHRNMRRLSGRCFDMSLNFPFGQYCQAFVGLRAKKIRE